MDGQPQPRELVYSQRLTEWILKLAPEASEALRIAARGQHVGRWTIPRDRYEMTRGGYLRWREDLKRFHAAAVAEIMKGAGYADEAIQRVQTIILKKNLREDPDVQIMEDALCLVFLETQLSDLRRKTLEEKMRDIIRKTWNKMSDKARETALALPLPAEDLALIQRSFRS